jgi:hypothetical protein
VCGILEMGSVGVLIGLTCPAADMRAFDEMKKLEMFFREETRRGSCSVVDLYELVQHAGNVLPRL